jgi:hypothetical protein
MFPHCALVIIKLEVLELLIYLPGSVELEFCFAFVQFLKMQRTIIRHF